MYVMGGGGLRPIRRTRWTSTILWRIAGRSANRSPNARRNFPTDTDGTNHIWLSGGYDSHGVAVIGLDGNLQLSSESLWVALANTHAYCNGNAYCNGDAYRYRQRRGLLLHRGRVPRRRLGPKVCV